MTPKRPPTMQDVASAAGVTKATVSLALNNHLSIPLTTRDRIKQVAREMGYHIHPFVSALMSHQRQAGSAAPNMILAYVTSHSSEDPWRGYTAYQQFFEGASRRAAEVGCRLEEFALGPSGFTPRRLRDILRARGIVGVLAAPLPRAETVFELDVTDFAVVGIGISVAQPHILQVANDHYHAARLAVQECVGLGYRRIAFAVSSEMSRRLEHRWLSAYNVTMTEAGLTDCISVYIPEYTLNFKAGLEAWCRKAKPEVIIFGTYENRCEACLPREVGMVSVGVADEAGKIAGISADWFKISGTAVDQLLAQMQHNNLGALFERRSHLICGRWIPGASAPGPGLRRGTVRSTQRVK